MTDQLIDDVLVVMVDNMKKMFVSTFNNVLLDMNSFSVVQVNNCTYRCKICYASPHVRSKLWVSRPKNYDIKLQEPDFFALMKL